MDSKDLTKFGLNNWFKADDETTLLEELKRMKGIVGVYVVRADRPIPRLKGESDVLYIGEGNVKNRVEELVKRFLPPSWKRNITVSHTARNDLERALDELGISIEISYVKCNSKEEAKGLENKLIWIYRQDHIESPPLNNTRG